MHSVNKIHYVSNVIMILCSLIEMKRVQLNWFINTAM